MGAIQIFGYITLSLYFSKTTYSREQMFGLWDTGCPLNQPLHSATSTAVKAIE